MIPRLTIVAVFVVGLAIVTGSTLAGDKKPVKQAAKPRTSIGGKVIGENGKPQADAEIRAVRTDVKAPVITAWTDSKGRYAFANLPVGQYSVTACVDTLPLSRANVQTRSNGWVKLDFDLQQQLLQGMSTNLGADTLRNFIPNQNPH